MKKIITFLSLCLVLKMSVFAQVGINADNSLPDPSAMLDVRSTNKGILIPRMTLSQRNSIATSTMGMLIFQTDNSPGFYFYNGISWTPVTPANQWNLTGNSGTTAANFLGTTDNVPLKIKINNENSGILDPGSLNAAFGYSSLTLNTGNSNTVLGSLALNSNTGGSNNTVIGTFAGFNNAGGSGNVFIGNSAGSSETGSNKLYIANTAYTPLIYGDFASGRVGLGTISPSANLDVNGSIKISDGTQGTNKVLTSDADGKANWQDPALHSWGLTGNAGTTPVNFIGTTDNAPLNFKTNNQASGILDPGTQNTAFGCESLPLNTSNANTAIGSNALHSSMSGSYNTAVGMFAGFSDISGSGNVFLGNGAGALETGSNKLYIANSSVNPLIYGDFSTGRIGLGTYNPAVKLDIMGNIKITDGTQGNGKVLTSDDIGSANWQPLPAQVIYTAGSGLSLSGGIFSNNAVTDATLSGNATTVTPLKISQQGAVSGQVLQWNGTSWAPGSVTPSGGAWNITGNANTSPSVNFIGTTNNQALKFRVNNQQSGLIDNTMKNTFYGYQSGNGMTTGNSNTALGQGALYSNTTGSFNTAMGIGVLYNTTTGSHLLAIGDSALFKQAVNNSGYYDNMAVGSRALYANTSGYSNVAMGISSLTGNTTGYSNTAAGDYSLLLNTTGYDNTATGRDALHANQTGHGNVATGISALFSNTTGANNTAIGYQAMMGCTTGSNNTTLGAGANCSVNNITDAAAIGYGATTNANDKIVIGTASNINLTGGYGTWQSFSDGRFKEDIKGNVPGLAFITKLNPVTYHLNAEKVDEFLGIRQRLETCMDAGEKSRYLRRLTEVSKQLQTGFIAQEVEATANSIGYAFDGVHHPESEKDNYSIGYASFVVPLVKAVQELTAINDLQKATNEDLKQQISQLLKRIEKLENR